MISTYRHFPNFFFFNDTATTEIYTLSLHDALPILSGLSIASQLSGCGLIDEYRFVVHPVIAGKGPRLFETVKPQVRLRSEEHTSELQSPCNLVCRLLLEKKKNIEIDFEYLVHLTVA